jgi:hypothetical protein
MELMVCVDGVESQTFALRDADDVFNDEVERNALSRAYELKMTMPDAVVAVVIVDSDTDAELASGALQVGLGH